ncbi:ThuA domain-containing protein [Paraflavitalea pollutisoli]|uniref:ThuA domain-containing protein n=1 Tax=Paraflavitalea pollutisoli TaxID=3034143 RepID=UPI0023EC3647|nr:ThuA domain-containing protein [Paraflavitalea sp. H1-2-19X]
MLVNMKARRCYNTALLMLLLAPIVLQAQRTTPRILVFSKTMRYYHESIPAGMKAIMQLGAANRFGVDTSTNPAVFKEENLRRYAAVVFVSPGGDVLDTAQQADFERYIQAGGGYVGIHAATTMEYGWPWYGRLAGAFFDGHPEPQDGVVMVADTNHASTRHLPRTWKRHDEWYNFKTMVSDLHVLLTVDESTYKGGKHGAYHPVAWYHAYDGGRAFYTALGHFDAAYADPLFLQHLLAGIQYAIGNNVQLDYSKATTQRIR